MRKSWFMIVAQSEVNSTGLDANLQLVNLFSAEQMKAWDVAGFLLRPVIGHARGGIIACLGLCRHFPLL